MNSAMLIHPNFIYNLKYIFELLYIYIYNFISFKSDTALQQQLHTDLFLHIPVHIA